MAGGSRRSVPVNPQSEWMQNVIVNQQQMMQDMMWMHHELMSQQQRPYVAETNLNGSNEGRKANRKGKKKALELPTPSDEPRNTSIKGKQVVVAEVPRSVKCSACGRPHSGRCRQGSTACFYCKGEGHYANKCPVKKRKAAEWSTPEEEPRGASSKGKRVQASKFLKPANCGKCGRPHGGECHLGSKLCFYCKMEGHYAKECPARKRNREWNSNSASGKVFVLDAQKGEADAGSAKVKQGKLKTVRHGYEDA